MLIAVDYRSDVKRCSSVLVNFINLPTNKAFPQLSLKAFFIPARIES